MRITILFTDFLALIEESWTFSSPSPKQPETSCVEFERVENTLVAVATDRLALGVSRIDADYDDVPEGWRVNLSRAQLRMWRDSASIHKRALPPSKRETEQIVITVAEGELTAQIGGVHATLPTQDLRLPDWRALFNRFDFTSAGASSVVSPGYLAAFQKAQRTNGDAVLVEGTGKPLEPLRLTVGEHFVGLLMPLRREDRYLYAGLHIDLGIG